MDFAPVMHQHHMAGQQASLLHQSQLHPSMHTLMAHQGAFGMSDTLLPIPTHPIPQLTHAPFSHPLHLPSNMVLSKPVVQRQTVNFLGGSTTYQSAQLSGRGANASCSYSADRTTTNLSSPFRPQTADQRIEFGELARKRQQDATAVVSTGKRSRSIGSYPQQQVAVPATVWTADINRADNRAVKTPQNRRLANALLAQMEHAKEQTYFSRPPGAPNR